VPLRSFASALRPGGWAVISLDHPLGRPLPGQRGGYFDTELVSDTWRKADVEVSQDFWHRPLAVIFNAFADAGFMVDRIAEPQPSDEALRLFQTNSRASSEHRSSSFTGSGYDRNAVTAVSDVAAVMCAGGRMRAFTHPLADSASPTIQRRPRDRRSVVRGAWADRGAR
jgi:hypothetical protein